MSMAEPTAEPIGLDPAETRTIGPRDERAFGFWLFLMCDAVAFALLFANHGVLVAGRAGGPGPDEILMPWALAAATLALLAASTAGGIAKVRAEAGDGRAAALAVGALALAGALGMSAAIWIIAQMIGMEAGPARSGYLSAVHAMLDMIVLHAALGLIWALTLVAQLAGRGAEADVASRVKRLGNFWHLVALIWGLMVIFVFLAGLAT